ncbi:hypothetical protein [Rhodopila sp.]|uniref:hypothetical protein n=1 Tax=Rhodopila sp. TaxID=2480087 RepID=UPI002BE5E824|nr:hypothetical protein [Rhodopila sp.]HVZ09327.1 hypothetical protein [Rhodopila sp.]
MALTTFSIGRDTQIVIMGSTGRIDISHVIAFESRQMTTPIRVSRIDGTQLGTELPRGWEGTFEVERGTSILDDFIAGIEQSFYNGNPIQPGTMYQYVTEADGSVSTYQFSGVVFKLANAGTWKGDAAVRQKLEFFATQRQRI